MVPYPTPIKFPSLLPPPKLPSKTLTPQFPTTDAATATDAGFFFREKLLYLKSLNVNSRKALTLVPDLPSTPLSAIRSVELSLASVGLRCADIGRILDMHPTLLTLDPHFSLYPIFNFLIHEVGIPFSDVSKSISRCPRLLVCSLEHQLRPALLFLRHYLGFVGPFSINCQTTMLLVYNVESTLKDKVEFLISLGFKFCDVKHMIVRSPGILTFSIENNLMPKFDYFMLQMNGDMEELKRFPQYFSFSLERKIKPRHRMLAKHGIKLPLWKMLKVSDGLFYSGLVQMKLRTTEEEN